MTKLSEKYLAGIVDADGTLGVKFFRQSSGNIYPQIYLKVSQETAKDKVLYLIQENFGGSIHTSGKNGKHEVVNFSCKQSRMLLYRIKKHLVVKREFAEFCLDYVKSNPGPIPQDEVKAHKEYIGEQRKKRTEKLPNFPARKWLAGFFDGDGCIACSYRKNVNRSYLSARITTEPAYDASIRLIHKAFGGKIYSVKKKEGLYPMLVIDLPPSKAQQFLGYFAKHTVVKWDQVYFVLGCAKGGNYRDGKPIKDTLSYLKAREQRLNDPGVNVNAFVRQVRFDVPDRRGDHMRKRQSSDAKAS